MQKFKRFLLTEVENAPCEQGTSVWATGKELPNGKQVVFLHVGRKQVATVVWGKQCIVNVPGLFVETASPDELSHQAMSVVNEIKSYL